MLERLKKDVHKANINLVKHGLIVFTWGNVSTIDRKNGLIAIKPSGFFYDNMTTEDMVIVDLNGKVIEGNLKPSSDTPTHITLYKSFSDIGGIAHTHSIFATSWAQAGILTPEWAARLGLSTDVMISVGAFDCHMGAIGAQISPNILVKTIGTSTCDIMVVPCEEIGDRLIPGICGQIDGSVIPDMVGLKAGQSAYGDIFAWFRQILECPLNNIFPALSEAAEKIPLSESSIVATDWLNERRTPDANQMLKAIILGLSLGSTIPAIFKALVEAAAANIHEDISTAQKNMGQGVGKTCFPEKETQQEYLKRYERYHSVAKFSEDIEL